jgi:hypothetical protein
VEKAFGGALICLAVVLVVVVGGIPALAVAGLMGGCGARLLFGDVRTWRDGHHRQT